MVKQNVKVLNKLGLHARPCSILVKTANQFRSDFKIIKDEMEVNGKSILGVMTLAAAEGSELVLQAEGIDEEYVLKEIAGLFENRFGEEE